MKTMAVSAALALLAVSSAVSASGERSVTSGAPVTVAVEVSPGTVGPGSDASVRVRLEPKPGIKMNKYPKIRLLIPGVPNLVASAEASVGSPTMPPADQLETNYYHGSVDPLEVRLHVDAKAGKGRHDLRGTLSYFYCVAASGFCAPAKVDLAIPVTVR
jgi:hypothetical protein